MPNEKYFASRRINLVKVLNEDTANSERIVDVSGTFLSFPFLCLFRLPFIDADCLRTRPHPVAD